MEMDQSFAFHNVYASALLIQQPPTKVLSSLSSILKNYPTKDFSFKKLFMFSKVMCNSNNHHNNVISKFIKELCVISIKI